MNLSEDTASERTTRNQPCDEVSPADLFVQLGYSMDIATRALEQCDFSFVAATQLLLYGGDATRAKFLAQTRFRRHTRKLVKVASASLAHAPVRKVYKERASAELGLEVSAADDRLVLLAFFGGWPGVVWLESRLRNWPSTASFNCAAFGRNSRNGLAIFGRKSR